MTTINLFVRRKASLWLTDWHVTHYCCSQWFQLGFSSPGSRKIEFWAPGPFPTPILLLLEAHIPKLEYIWSPVQYSSLTACMPRRFCFFFFCLWDDSSPFPLQRFELSLSFSICFSLCALILFRVCRKRGFTSQPDYLQPWKISNLALFVLHLAFMWFGLIIHPVSWSWTNF